MDNYVVMPVRNCLQYTISSINSLLKQTVPVKIWVLNQGSKDGTALWLDRHLSDNLQVSHFYPPFRSLSECWNHALTQLFRKTERVLVVNNDTEFREDTYERLWQHQVDSGRHFVTAVSVGTKEQLESGEVEPERRGERPHPDFSCFLIDKYCWTRVGPFDPHFRPAFREDQDYHWRMKQAGVEAVCIDLPFLHYASQTVKNNPKDAEKVAKWDGFRERYYKEKWGGMWPEEKFKEPFDSKRHECKICRIR